MSHNDLVRTAQEKKCYEAAPHLCIAAGIWAVFLMASRGERREPLRVFPLQKKKKKKRKKILLKPCTQGSASSGTGNGLTATYANS